MEDLGLAAGAAGPGARRARAVGIALSAAVCFFLGLAQPAGAHGGGGISATNYETKLEGITPALPGVRIRVLEAGNRLELRNDGPEVMVLGYDDEPYLRVGPDGAFENRRSPTASLNRQPVHDPAAPTRADPTAPAEWRKLSDAPVVRWHQHSIHWMGHHDPPQVESHPGRRHVVYPRWEVKLERDGMRAVDFGTLTWVPGPSPAPWFALMAGAFLGVGTLGLLRRWGGPLAAAAAVIVVADIAHTLSVAFAYAGGLGTHLTKVFTGSFYAMAGWALAAVAIRLLRRGRVDGLYAGVFAGLSIALFGGMLDLAKLSRSTSLSTLPSGMARLLVAISAGAGLGLAAACLLAIQRSPEARRVLGNPGDQDLEQPSPVAATASPEAAGGPDGR